MKLIGLISDTHSAGSGQDLPDPVMDALAGVDLILHCGDLECIGVLDYLETVAPVLAVRGYEDPTEPGDRLADATRVVVVEQVRIGMVHDIQWPLPRIPTTPGRDRAGLSRRPGRRPDGAEVRPAGGRGSLWRHPRGAGLLARRRAVHQPGQSHLPRPAAPARFPGDAGPAAD